MSEAPAEDVAEQSLPASLDTAIPEDQEGEVVSRVSYGDEVDPADAAEQDREVPVDEDEWR